MRYLLLASLLFVAACAGKSVYTPKPSEQAVGAEREVQKGIADGKARQGKYQGEMKSTQYYQTRLDALAPRIQQAGIKVCNGMGKKDCVFGFKLKEDRTLNAYADGKDIYMTTGMMEFAGSDADIAVILAHEYAHNVLAHVSSTKQNMTIGVIGGTIIDALLSSQGINTGGQVSQLGAGYARLRYSKTFEQEADHVGLYIAEQANFPLANAPKFWRRMSTVNPDAIYSGSTHPTNPERYVAMNETVQEIKRKKAAGLPLIPEAIKD